MMLLFRGSMVIGLSAAIGSTVRGEQPANDAIAVLESVFRDYLRSRTSP